MSDTPSDARPNLFVVGAPKCGTTSLWHYLDQHPNIYMSPVKEPRFWSSDLREQGRRFHGQHLRRHLRSLRALASLPLCWRLHRRLQTGEYLGIEKLDDYLALFKSADTGEHRYRGEASPDSMWSEVAARRIAEFDPRARIVIMLREPLSYIVSIHRESCSGRIGERVTSLPRALAMEPRRRSGRDIPCTVRYPFSVLYREQAHFDVQVARFSRNFDRGQIHFILLEDLAADPVHALDELFAFLELPAMADRIDLQPWNVTNEPGSCDLDEASKRALRLEMLPRVLRLEQQTGIPLRRKWRYG